MYTSFMVIIFVVARNESHVSGGVLIRAIQPIRGIETMRALRTAALTSACFTNGPGKLTQALAINRSHNAVDMTIAGSLYIEDHGYTVSSIVETPRIGIRVAQDMLWRFYTTDFVNRV
jgi:DNA-3-methyladenine glycosylase